MESPISERLKVIFWLFLTAVLVVVPLIPSIFGISDELIRSSFLSVAALIIATLLLIQFSIRGRISLIYSPISILLFFILFIIILSSYFSMSKSQSLFGFGMEMGTTASFAILFLFYAASRKFFFNLNLINVFYKVISASFLVLTPIVFITTSLNTTDIVFNVFDFTVFSGLILLISTATFEFGKRNIYTLLLVGIAYFGLFLGSDKSVLVSLVVGILIIIFSKFFLIKKTTENIKAPYLSGIVLISICALFFFNIQPIIDSNQQGEFNPSWEATRVISSKAVVDNPLRAILGTGPNTFSHTWDLYKPKVINNTPVWNINFQNGVGGIPTLFVTIGLLGGTSFLLLIGTVFYVGVLGLIRSYSNRKRFYLISTTFATSIYGLLMFVLQNQSIAYLVLTFVFLGILSTLVGTKKMHTGILLHKVFKIILLIFFALILIFSTFFVLAKVVHTTSFEREVVSFNNTSNIERALNNVTCPNKYISHSKCYRFLAEMHRNNLQTIFSKDTITLTNEEVSGLSSLMLINAQKAVESNRVYYRNWVVLGNAYTQLAVMGADDGLNKGMESYNKAIELSPTNPFLLLLKARLMYYIGGDTFGARQIVQKSLNLKPDYEPSIKFFEDIEI